MFCADGLALLLKMSDLNEGPGGATSVRLRWLVLAGQLLISNAQAIKVSCWHWLALFCALSSHVLLTTRFKAATVLPYFTYLTPDLPCYHLAK
jgi:hypothetical protein